MPDVSTTRSSMPRHQVHWERERYCWRRHYPRSIQLERERKREREIVGGDNNRAPCNLKERERDIFFEETLSALHTTGERERYCWRRHHPRTIQLEREILLEETPPAHHTTGERDIVGGDTIRAPYNWREKDFR